MGAGLQLEKHECRKRLANSTLLGWIVVNLVLKKWNEREWSRFN
jgi:hypothetical protein